MTQTAKPMHTLIDLAKKRCDEAAQRLGSVMAQARDSEYKCGTLAAYRDDYRARLDGAVHAGVAGADLRNFQGFLAKLEDAVRQQAAEAAHWRQTVETARQLWQEEQKRMRSYGLIEERRTVIETRDAARREQRLQDEFAARRRAPTGAALAFTH